MNRRPGFFHGAVAAACLAFAASGMLILLTPVFGVGTVIRLAAPTLALAYLLYFFRASRARTGRIVTIAAWGMFAMLAWWFVPSTPFYLLLHVGGIWVIRSLHAYASLLPAVVDLGVAVLGTLAFAWAFTRTGSIFLATWCFFLLQALWTSIPRKPDRRRIAPQPATDNEPFERARRRADTALRDLLGRSG